MKIIRVAGQINPVNGATSRSYLAEMPRTSLNTFNQYAKTAAELFYSEQEKVLVENIKKNLKSSYGLDPESNVVKGIEDSLLQLAGDIERNRVQLQTSRSGIVYLLAKLGYDKFPSVTDIVYNGDFTCLVKDEMFVFEFRRKALTIVFVDEEFPS